VTTTTDAEGSIRALAESVLSVATEAAAAYQRPELAAILQRRHERLLSNTVRVVVVGEFKAGKSSLVNAALRADLCPTDDAIATAVPTIVRYGSTVTAVGLTAESNETKRVQIPVDARFSEIREDGRSEPKYSAIELTLPRPILAAGLEIIDTPGIGGLNSTHTAAAIAAAEQAEAAIFVTDASQELSRPELVALERLVDRCPNVFVVLTKCDLFPAWQRIKELNEAHLERAGLYLPILAVSTPLRNLAVHHQDEDLNIESGYAELLSILRTDVVEQAELFAVDQVVHDLHRVIDQLEHAFEVERAALTDAESAAIAEAELTRASDRAEKLKQESARWQTSLNDGVSDLMADVDHDLRGRFRSVLTDASERIDDLDPRQSWDEFTPWLEQQVADALLANHHLLHERTEGLAHQVLGHFRQDEAECELPTFLPKQHSLEFEARVDDLDLESNNPLKQVLGGLRGSYSGLLMFGAFGGIAGVAVATPVLAGIGVLLGARQVRDERSKQLKAHRQQAVTSVRKYVEDVTFVANKGARDSVKLVQRSLREHCTGEARAVQEEVRQLLLAVRDARATTDPTSRLNDMDAEVARLAQLRTAVEALCD